MAMQYKVVQIQQYADDLQTQLNTIGSGSYELVNIYNNMAVLMSGSSGINVSGSVILPAGVVSSSTQIQQNLPAGTVSSSTQAANWTVLSASYAATTSYAQTVPTSSVTGVLSYGQWFSVQTQSGSANTASVITYDSQSFGNGYTLVSGSRITALNTGVYNFQFSLQLKNVSNDNILYNIWFRQNGIDDAWSNTIYEIDKQPSTFGSNVAALNYMTTMNSGSYLELAWSADNVGARIFATGSVGGPTRPGVPSAIMTVTQVG